MALESAAADEEVFIECVETFVGTDTLGGTAGLRVAAAAAAAAAVAFAGKDERPVEFGSVVVVVVAPALLVELGGRTRVAVG